MISALLAGVSVERPCTSDTCRVLVRGHNYYQAGNSPGQGRGEPLN